MNSNIIVDIPNHTLQWRRNATFERHIFNIFLLEESPVELVAIRLRVSLLVLKGVVAVEAQPQNASFALVIHRSPTLLNKWYKLPWK